MLVAKFNSVWNFVNGAWESINLCSGNISIPKKIITLLKIIYYRAVYKFDSREYFYYHLNKLSREKRLMILPKLRQIDLYLKVNTERARAIATDKFASYCLFKDYYKRDICVYNPNSNGLILPYNDGCNNNLLDFIVSHEKFIVKPLSASSGKGVVIIDTKDYSSSDALMTVLIDTYKDGFVVEELIVSDIRLSKFHPQSVNTVRMNTFLDKSGNVEIKFPGLRIGRGDSIVDNANSGGISVAIDVESGRTLSAADEMGYSYTNHPDTGESLSDFEIPEWKAACDMVIQMAKKFEGCKIVGWDLALTEKGWVLVEANAHPLLIHQIAIQKGIKKEVMEIFNKII